MALKAGRSASDLTVVILTMLLIALIKLVEAERTLTYTKYTDKLNFPLSKSK